IDFDGSALLDSDRVCLLDGIEHLTSLSGILLPHHQVESPELLIWLNNIDTISFANNPSDGFSDLSFICSLHSLTGLNLASIPSVDALPDTSECADTYTSLSSLNLAETSIIDVSALLVATDSTNVSLTELIMNGVSLYDDVAETTSLFDPSILESFSSITFLELASLGLVDSDLLSIVHLPLVELNVADNSLVDISPLYQLNGDLATLDISYNSICLDGVDYDDGSALYDFFPGANSSANPPPITSSSQDTSSCGFCSSSETAGDGTDDPVIHCSDTSSAASLSSNTICRKVWDWTETVEEDDGSGGVTTTTIYHEQWSVECNLYSYKVDNGDGSSSSNSSANPPPITSSSQDTSSCGFCSSSETAGDGTDDPVIHCSDTSSAASLSSNTICRKVWDWTETVEEDDGSGGVTTTTIYHEQWSVECNLYSYKVDNGDGSSSCVSYLDESDNYTPPASFPTCVNFSLDNLNIECCDNYGNDNSCIEGWYGSSCDEKCPSINYEMCGGYGDCSDATHTCVCNDGMTGEFCSEMSNVALSAFICNNLSDSSKVELVPGESISCFGDNSEEMLPSDLIKIKYLNLSGESGNITTLEGLSAATNLESLDISNLTFDSDEYSSLNLSLLQDLSNLYTLNIANTNVILDADSNLPSSLIEVNIDNTDQTSFEFIPTGVQILYANSCTNLGTFLDQLKEFEDLTVLELSGCQISDPSPLYVLDSQLTDLDISYNNICGSDISSVMNSKFSHVDVIFGNQTCFCPGFTEELLGDSKVCSETKPGSTAWYVVCASDSYISYTDASTFSCFSPLNSDNTTYGCAGGCAYGYECRKDSESDPPACQQVIVDVELHSCVADMFGDDETHVIVGTASDGVSELMLFSVASLKTLVSVEDIYTGAYVPMLSCSYSTVSSVAGIEHLVNVKEIKLIQSFDSGSIVDLKYLSSLSNLLNLYLPWNSCLTTLPDMTLLNLEILNIEGTSIALPASTDTSTLLPSSLQYLFMYDTPTEQDAFDIQVGVDNLFNLKTISLGNNDNISSISSLTGQLEQIIIKNTTAITDLVTVIESKCILTSVKLVNVGLSSIPNLSNSQVTLTFLNLSNNSDISSVYPIIKYGLTNLYRFVCSNCSLSDLSPLYSLPYLLEITLIGNNFCLSSGNTEALVSKFYNNEADDFKLNLGSELSTDQTCECSFDDIGYTDTLIASNKVCSETLPGSGTWYIVCASDSVTSYTSAEDFTCISPDNGDGTYGCSGGCEYGYECRYDSESTSSSCQQVIVDENLHACVADMFGENTDHISDSSAYIPIFSVASLRTLESVLDSETQQYSPILKCNSVDITTLDGIEHLVNVSEVDLTDVTTIESADLILISTMSKLKGLVLSGCTSISSLPDLSLVPLESLFMAGTNITLQDTIDPTLLLPSSLKVLSILNVLITQEQFSAQISVNNLPNLEYLILGGENSSINSISTLGTNITTLKIESTNLITDIPVTVSSLLLEELDLINIDLDVIPDLSNSQETLKTLSISSNSKLSSVHEVFEYGLTKLETLTFMNCNVSDLSPLYSLGSLNNINGKGNKFCIGSESVATLSEKFNNSEINLDLGTDLATSQSCQCSSIAYDIDSTYTPITDNIVCSETKSGSTAWYVVCASDSFTTYTDASTFTCTQPESATTNCSGGCEYGYECRYLGDDDNGDSEASCQPVIVDDNLRQYIADNLINDSTHMDDSDSSIAPKFSVASLRNISYPAVIDYYTSEDSDKIQNVDGIEHLGSSLTNLILNFNLISDPSPLKTLTYLTNLSLMQNVDIDDMSFICSLTNLDSLNMNYTSCSSIPATELCLSTYSSLHELYLVSTSILDISPLLFEEDPNGDSNINSTLTTLDLNSVSKYDEISDSYEYFDISILQSFTAIEAIDLQSLGIENEDLQYLMHLPLKSLCLITNNISDLSPILHFNKTLTLLYLGYNRICPYADVIDSNIEFYQTYFPLLEIIGFRGEDTSTCSYCSESTTTSDGSVDNPYIHFDGTQDPIVTAGFASNTICRKVWDWTETVEGADDGSGGVTTTTIYHEQWSVECNLYSYKVDNEDGSSSCVSYLDESDNYTPPASFPTCVISSLDNVNAECSDLTGSDISCIEGWYSGSESELCIYECPTQENDEGLLLPCGGEEEGYGVCDMESHTCKCEGSYTGDACQYVNFTNSVLESFLCDLDEIDCSGSDGHLTPDILATITKLDLSDVSLVSEDDEYSISDALDGLRFATSLEELDLSVLEFTIGLTYDLSELSELSSLKTLNLSGNDMSSTSEPSCESNIAALPSSLTTLILDNVGLEETDADFSGLSQLATLSVRDNPTFNPEDDEEFTASSRFSASLQNLNIGGCSEISDISFIPTYLTTLIADGCSLDETTDFSAFLSLTTLDVSDNLDYDVTNEVCLPESVTSFYAANTSISQIYEITIMLPNVVNLDLSDNSISDPSPLFSLSSTLTALDLSGNNICGMDDEEEVNAFVSTFPLLTSDESTIFASNVCPCDDDSISLSSNIVCSELWPGKYSATCCSSCYTDVSSSSLSCVLIDDDETSASLYAVCSSLSGTNKKCIGIGSDVSVDGISIVCSEGWFGDDCLSECPVDEYGYECGNADGTDTCDSETHTCTCSSSSSSPLMTGDLCEIESGVTLLSSLGMDVALVEAICESMYVDDADVQS
ncbi:hypothetical protein ADUPG1_000890, partial [Aduncisulcus paluster]